MSAEPCYGMMKRIEIAENNWQSDKTTSTAEHGRSSIQPLMVINKNKFQCK